MVNLRQTEVLQAWVPTPLGVPSPTLDVICVGFGRTGTHSLREALRRLGFWPSEHAENCNVHPERYALWLDALRRKRAGEPIDWRPLFAGYRATLDWPGAYFWRELIAAHPEAKVILTVRDPERWYESARSTIYAKFLRRTQTLKGRYLRGLHAWLDPRAGHQFRISQEVVWDGTFSGQFGNREHAIRVFEEHKRMVQETVPSERLLVFDVQQGWAPLCQFLGTPVPVGEPFPYIPTTVKTWRRRLQYRVGLVRLILPPLGAAAAGGAAGVVVSICRQTRRCRTSTRSG